jgi:hypothetical protein
MFTMKHYAIHRSLLVGMILTMVLSACRFGNYSESPKAPEKFSSIEMFRTQPRTFLTYVQLNDGSENMNESTPLSAIPESLLDNFTDPLYIAQPISTPGVKLFIGARQSDCFYNPDDSSCIGTIVEVDGTIAVETSSPFSQFGSNPSCKMNLQMRQNGALDRSRPGTITYSDGSVGRISGDLQLDFAMIRTFQGDCSGILTVLAACYTSGVGCTNEELYWANQLFGLYARQSGVLRMEDAARIKVLAYNVRFE